MPSPSPSKKDRRGIKARRKRADVAVDHLHVTLLVRLRNRASARSDADGNPVGFFACAMTRAQRVEWDRLERLADKRTEQLSAAYRASRERDEEPPAALQVVCWCGRRVVLVPAVDISHGTTGTCGAEDCAPWPYTRGAQR